MLFTSMHEDLNLIHWFWMVLIVWWMHSKHSTSHSTQLSWQRVTQQTFTKMERLDQPDPWNHSTMSWTPPSVEVVDPMSIRGPISVATGRSWFKELKQFKLHKQQQVKYEQWFNAIPTTLRKTHLVKYLNYPFPPWGGFKGWSFRRVYIHRPKYWKRVFHGKGKLHFIMKNWYCETYNILKWLIV